MEEGFAKLRDKEENKFLEVHNVDAKEIVQSDPGRYEYVAPEIVEDIEKSEKVRKLKKEMNAKNVSIRNKKAQKEYEEKKKAEEEKKVEENTKDEE
jgi:hypothetical protein